MTWNEKRGPRGTGPGRSLIGEVVLGLSYFISTTNHVDYPDWRPAFGVETLYFKDQSDRGRWWSQASRILNTDQREKEEVVSSLGSFLLNETIMQRI